MQFKRTIPLLAGLLLFVFLWTQVPAQAATAVFINEIHYDNVGTDSGEAIEVVGPAGTDLTGWKIVLYNGANNLSYDTDALSGVISNQCDGYGTVVINYPTDGIQNGSPDGLALVDNTDTVIQFLSYEGSITALNGPANGMSSNNIGVSETNTTPVGNSLQLSGTGTIYGDFTWQSPATSSFGSCNPGQTFIGGGDIAPTVSNTNPINNATAVSVNTAITINFSEAVTAAANAFSLECPSGSAVPFSTSPALPGSSTSFTLTPGSNLPNSTTCQVTVTAANIADQDSPVDNMAANYPFSFTTQNASGITYIHDVQGAGSSVAIAGAVTVTGVVVGDFQGSSELDGFFIQEENADADANPATSEGIFVYCNTCTTAVAEGQIVSVTGTAEEFSESSQINVTTGGSSVTVINAGNNSALVTPTAVSLPVSAVSALEAFEGMLVTFTQELTVTEHYQLGRYGNVLLSSGGHLMTPTQIAAPGAPATAVLNANLRNQILIDDNSTTQNPDPIIYPAPGLSAANPLRTGSTVTGLTGVINYSFNAYSLQPTLTPAFAATNPRTATPPVVGGTLKVASFNVLNYFNGDGVGGGFPTSRGATNSTEFTRQRSKIISAITALNADIVGLMEIENDGYGANSAIQDLVNGLNTTAGGPVWAFVNPSPLVLGADEITVGFIYKTASVSPVGSAATLSTGAFADRNRQPLVQTFKTPGVNGESLTVAVNHFKSKGSACTGDPDLNDGQGNCNITRTNAASELASWLAADPTSSGDPDFIIMGDLNAYAQEDPIKALKNAGYTNLFASFVQNSYSYVFDGQMGTLDYILGNAALTTQVTGAAAWHINADEPISLDYNTEFKSVGQIASLYAADAYRASDHDPVIIGLNLDSTLAADFSDLDSVYNTAWHTGSGAIRLGPLWDADTAFAATADDASDDGVTVGPGTGSGGQWQPGTNGASLNITVAGTGSGCLYAWVDWNGDGLFDDNDAPGNLEYAIRSVAVNPGTANYQFDVPANQFQTPPGASTPLQSYNVRVRLYGTCSSGPTGAAVNGEVEDYTFTFRPTAVTLQSFSATNQNTLWLAVLLVIVTLLAGSLLMWRKRLH